MSDKYMKEIEEVLKQAEEVMPDNRSRPPERRAGPSGRFFNPLGRITGGRGMKVSPSKLMLASFALLLLALILGAMGIGSVVHFVVAGLILFVIAYALFFVRPSTESYQKRWRGRLIEERLPLVIRLRRWLKN